MPYESLGEFLAGLQDSGELTRVPVEVDATLEISALTQRVARHAPNGGPALLFESVKGFSIPVVTNLLASHRRLCQCLGVAQLNEVTARLDRASTDHADNRRVPSLSTGFWDSLKRWRPQLVKTAPCQQVIRMGRDVNLWELPIPRSWPGESHPVVTSGLLFTERPETGSSFCCAPPLAVVGPQELGWYTCSSSERLLLKSMQSAQRNLPVAISLGGDPTLAVAAELPELGDPRLLAGGLRGASLDVVRCRTSELSVPASSEFILEGYVDFENAGTSQPVSIARGNGRYITRPCTSIRITAMTHRANPVLPARIILTPPSEESWIQQAAERIRMSLLQLQFPEIVDMHQPFCGAGRNLLFVSIKKTVDFQAKRILHSLWGMESLGQTKMIVIVDADQNVFDEQQVWFTVGTNACPKRDFVYADGQARDDDYTVVSGGLACRVGIDATRKSVVEASHDWPQSVTMSEELDRRIVERWSEYGFPSER